MPKTLLEQSGLSRDVAIEVDQNRFTVQPISKPREGWGESFRSMAEQGHDKLLDEGLTGRLAWDENEWEW